MNQDNDCNKVEGLISWLRQSMSATTSPGKRMRCLEYFADLNVVPDKDLIEEVLIKVLKEDPNPVIRHEAAFVLGRISCRSEVGVKTISALCESARTDASTIVRHEAT